jgi:acetyl esterase/lipase
MFSTVCRTERFVLPLFLCAALCAQDRGLDEILKLPVSPGARRMAYGSDPQQFGELRVPEGRGPFPVAVIVHGGCWMARLGNLDEHATALDLLRPMAGELTRSGIATWNLEYRRLGNGGGWPETFDDVARGTDYLRKIAAEYRLDLNRVAAIGHSAGGHLVMWLAARRKLPPSSDLYAEDPLPLKGVVDLDGPGDLKALLPMQQRICGAPVITQLLGGTPEEQPQRYREASPVEMLPLGVRQEFFAGQMFAAQAAAYEEAAKRAGDAVTTLVLPKAGHFIWVDPGSAVWPQVERSVKEVLGIRR